MCVPALNDYVSWPVVRAMVGDDIPYSELPADPVYYIRETGAYLQTCNRQAYQLCTAGLIRVIERHRSMKKEAEFKRTIEKLTGRQQKNNANYEKLAAQYEQLLESYNAMKRAYEVETETTKALKLQLDEIQRMLSDTEPQPAYRDLKKAHETALATIKALRKERAGILAKLKRAEGIS